MSSNCILVHLVLGVLRVKDVRFISSGKLESSRTLVSPRSRDFRFCIAAKSAVFSNFVLDRLSVSRFSSFFNAEKFSTLSLLDRSINFSVCSYCNAVMSVSSLIQHKFRDSRTGRLANADMLLTPVSDTSTCFSCCISDKGDMSTISLEQHRTRVSRFLNFVSTETSINGFKCKV
jgi:hypothetical protein